MSKGAKRCTVEFEFAGALMRYRDGAAYWTLPAGHRCEVDGMPSRLYAGEGRSNAVRLRLPHNWYKLSGRAMPLGRWRVALLGEATRDGFHVMPGALPLRLVRADAPAQSERRSWSPVWSGTVTRVDAVSWDLEAINRRREKLPPKADAQRRRPGARPAPLPRWRQ